MVILKKIRTEIGEFVAGVYDDKLCLFEFQTRRYIDEILLNKSKQYDSKLVEGDHPIFNKLEHEIHEYISNERRIFSIPLHIQGTEFQMNVWNELLKIPYGKTISYSELAKRIGNPSAARAVGRANGSNNIAILIPCHRVIDKSGDLRGYGGGLSNKKKLLAIESQSPLLNYF